MAQGLISSLLGLGSSIVSSSWAPKAVEQRSELAAETVKEGSLKKPRLAAAAGALEVPLYVSDVGILDLPVSGLKDQDASCSPQDAETCSQQHSQTRMQASKDSKQQLDGEAQEGTSSHCCRSDAAPVLDQQERVHVKDTPSKSAGVCTPGTPEDDDELLYTPVEESKPWASAPEVDSTQDFQERMASPAEAEALNQCLGAFELQGARPYQEDRMSFVLMDDVIHIGLFDGHAGHNTSSYLQAYLLRAVCQKMQQGLPAPRALTEAFLVTNSHLRCMQSSFYSGSTATVAMVDGHRIICANAGDSPAFVVSKSGQVTCLTMEHNPNTNDDERLRVQAAGGRIEKMHWGERHKRVLSYDSLSGLAMTRAFGDFNFTGVICDPHISTLDFVAEDALFLVIASDGLTEQWTVEGAAAAVLEFARDGCNPTEIAVRLSHRAMDTGSRDNISVVILDLELFKNLYHKQAVGAAAAP